MTITNMDTKRIEDIINHAFPPKPKQYYHGIKDVEYVWHGTQSDPELIYKGHSFCYWDIEDALCCMFWEDNPELDLSGEWADDIVAVNNIFDEYVKENCVPYLDDVVFSLEEAGE